MCHYMHTKHLGILYDASDRYIDMQKNKQRPMFVGEAVSYKFYHCVLGMISWNYIGDDGKKVLSTHKNMRRYGSFEKNLVSHFWDILLLGNTLMIRKWKTDGKRLHSLIY